MDSLHNNWIIQEEFMSLSFSYMCFVIKHQLDQNPSLSENNLFDSEPYNYIFNGSTVFLDSPALYNSHIKLKHILSNLEKFDRGLLEILNFA